MDRQQLEISPEEISDFLIHKTLSKNLQTKIKLITDQMPNISRLEALEILLDYLEN